MLCNFFSLTRLLVIEFILGTESNGTKSKELGEDEDLLECGLSGRLKDLLECAGEGNVLSKTTGSGVFGVTKDDAEWFVTTDGGVVVSIGAGIQKHRK